MKRVQVEAIGRTTAPPSIVYEIEDSSGFPRWSRIGSFELLRPGRDEPFGVGSLRLFRTGPIKGQRTGQGHSTRLWLRRGAVYF